MYKDFDSTKKSFPIPMNELHRFVRVDVSKETL